MSDASPSDRDLDALRAVGASLTAQYDADMERIRRCWHLWECDRPGRLTCVRCGAVKARERRDGR